MNEWTPFILSVLGMALLVGYAMFRHAGDVNNKARMAKSLGLTPLDHPPRSLESKIFSLHRTGWPTTDYSLLNVSHRILKDGELFLFDLVDKSSPDSYRWIQIQAVAIRSASLRLPPFQLHPKMTWKKVGLALLKNKFAAWNLPKVGQKVKFPQFPAFQERYWVTSEFPEAAKRFFDARLAHYFAKTDYYSLRADDDLLVFVDLEPDLNVNHPDHMTRRLKRALEIYRLLRQV